MLKKLSIRKIGLTTAALFALALIYLLPSNDNKLDITSELEYVDSKVETNPIFLMDKNSYAALTDVAVSGTSVEDKARELLNILTVGGADSKIPSGFSAIIPPDTIVNSLKYADGLIKIDFSKDLLDIDKELEKKYSDRNLILVDDSVKFLNNIAKKRRDELNIPVIAVTGSVGKTSTKNIIADTLSLKYKVLKTSGNLNTDIGLSLTILSLTDEEIMVLEMGMCLPGEISTLTAIARPNIAVITNIGTAHIGALGSRENILKAKLEIIEGLQDTLIVNNNETVNLEALSYVGINLTNIKEMDNEDINEAKNDAYKFFKVDPGSPNREEKLSKSIEKYKLRNELVPSSGYVNILLLMSVIVTSISTLIIFLLT